MTSVCEWGTGPSVREWGAGPEFFCVVGSWGSDECGFGVLTYFPGFAPSSKNMYLLTTYFVLTLESGAGQGQWRVLTYFAVLAPPSVTCTYLLHAV